VGLLVLWKAGLVLWQAELLVPNSTARVPDLEGELASPVADRHMEPLIPHWIQSVVLHVRK
jgi:hypothetical protein